MAWLTTCLVVFQMLLGHTLAGSFVGKVEMKYNVFTVLESGSFEITCEATHEDERPQLRWFVINSKFRRTNITAFSNKRGTGNTAIDTFRKSGVSFSDSGDYYCEARVVMELETQMEKSIGVPIMVISAEKTPKVSISKYLQRTGANSYTCEVVPVGLGDLTWYRDDVEVLSKRKVSELVLKSTSRGEFKCVGNLTIGGYTFFRSYATTSGGIALSQLVSKITYLVTIALCFLTVVNFSIIS